MRIPHLRFHKITSMYIVSKDTKKFARAHPFRELISVFHACIVGDEWSVALSFQTSLAKLNRRLTTERVKFGEPNRGYFLRLFKLEESKHGVEIHDHYRSRCVQSIVLATMRAWWGSAGYSLERIPISKVQKFYH